MRFLNFILFAFVLTSCEGFKVLTLTNRSRDNLTLTIKPKIGMFDNRYIHNYPNEPLGDSLVVMLPSDSSFILLSIFTTMIDGAKIKPRDLRINYLKIESKGNTITAETKEEILDLVKDPRTRYRRKVDKPMTNGKNFANIMIRE